MKHTSLILILLSSFFFLSSSFFTIGKINYLIDEASSLAIEGTSNVTGFECRCNQPFLPKSVETLGVAGRDKITFRGAKLSIETKSFDCGHKGINKDMHKALKAEAHPYITIELMEVFQKHPFAIVPENDWIQMTAKAELTIAQCTQTVDLEVRGMALDSGRYRFVCAEELLMTSFNIQPPKPMLGLIKVDDKITIAFDLIINLLEV